MLTLTAIFPANTGDNALDNAYQLIVPLSPNMTDIQLSEAIDKAADIKLHKLRSSALRMLKQLDQSYSFEVIDNAMQEAAALIHPASSLDSSRYVRADQMARICEMTKNEKVPLEAHFYIDV